MIQRLLLSALLCGGGACGSSGADSGTPTSVATAAAGGSLMLTGGSLRIPAGALAADTSISVKESAPSADTPSQELINGLIYDLGPDGTTFKTPAELALPLTGPVPPDMTAVVAFLEARTKTWMPLSSSVVGAADAQKVTALAMHLAPHAVLIVPIGGVCPAPASCGGELVGSWELATFCQEYPPPVVAQDCMDGTFQTARTVTSLTGTLTITAEDRYNFSRPTSIDHLVSFPPACLALNNRARNAKVVACADLQPDLTATLSTATTCAGTVSDGCTCFASTPLPDVEMGTIAVQGPAFVTTVTGEAPRPSNFCVQGNVLFVLTGDGFVYTATRKL